MSEKMTRIRLKGTRAGFMDWGEHTFEEMVTKLRGNAQRDLETAMAVLEANDEDFEVALVRGPIVQHLIRKVEPRSA